MLVCTCNNILWDSHSMISVYLSFEIAPQCSMCIIISFEFTLNGQCNTFSFEIPLQWSVINNVLWDSPSLSVCTVTMSFKYILWLSPQWSVWNNGFWGPLSMSMYNKESLMHLKSPFFANWERLYISYGYWTLVSMIYILYNDTERWCWTAWACSWWWPRPV